MFNRNFRRDNRGDSFRNNNVSHGHNAPSLMSVSPWEGGVVPGSSGGNSILGMPMQNTNLLSPQAQVLAQNLSLLSNLGLLQPQVQTRQSQGVNLPSLINLGSAMNRSMGPQQNSNYRQMNQQPNRGMGGNRFQDQARYGRQDVRRPEPFNKNRPRPSQSQPSQQKLQSYRPLNSKVQQQAARKPSGQDAQDLAKARAAVRGRHVPSKDSPVAVAEGKAEEETTKKEEGDEVVKKRDWKKEKKADVIEIDDDEEKADKADVKMEVEEEVVEVKPNGDAVPSVEKDAPEGESGAESKEKAGETSKTGNAAGTVPYNCHVCTKDLTDEKALQGHLRTAAHKKNMSLLEDSYALKVKRIRDQLRSNENIKERDLMRNRRANVQNMPRGHCKMCDLSFLGNITAHRKAPLHLKLKSFLHPNCVPCGKEFPARMEWDMHKLTVDHFKMTCCMDKKVRALTGSPSAHRNSSDVNYAKLVPKFPEGLHSVAGNLDEEKADQLPATDGEAEAGGPKYDPKSVFGLNMLCHGQHCGVCNKFFARRPDSMEHCKTRTHFDNVNAFKTKLKEEAAEKERLEAEAKASAEAEAKAAAAAKEEETPEAASEVQEDESETPESAEAEVKEIKIGDKVPVVCLKRTSGSEIEDEGNWKRSRSTKKDEEDEDDENVESQDDDEALKNIDIGIIQDANLLDALEKYDPLEATSPDPSAVDAELSQTGEAETTETSSPTTKAGNKARRGRKRK